MKKKILSLLLISILFLVFIHNAEATKRVWGFYNLIGGAGTEALDAIPSTGGGTIVVTGDYAIGRDSSGYFYIYYYDGTSLTASSSPRVIRPADKANDTIAGRWLIAPRLYSDAYFSTALDLAHFLNVSNSSDPTFTRSDGDFYTRSDHGIPYLYNIADAENVPILNAKRKYFPTSSGSGGSTTLLTRHMFGATISNVYATGPWTYNVPAAEMGMEVTFYCATANMIYIDVLGTNDTLRGNGGCTTAGWRVQSSNPPTIGDCITLRTMYNPSKIGGAGYDWYLTTRVGTWTCAGS